MATRKVAKDGCILYLANRCLAVFMITNTGFSSFSYSPRDQKTVFFDTFPVSMATRKVAKDGCIIDLANSCLAVFIITNTGFSSFSYSPRDQKTGLFDTFSVSMETIKVAKDSCKLYLANSCLEVFMITNTGFSSFSYSPRDQKTVFFDTFPVSMATRKVAKDSCMLYLANSCLAVFIITNTGFSSFSYSPRDQKTVFSTHFFVSMATRKVAKDSCMLYIANSCLAVFIITNTGFSSFSYSPRDQKTNFFDTFPVSMATRKVAKDSCILYLANSCQAVFIITSTGFSSFSYSPRDQKTGFFDTFSVSMATRKVAKDSCILYIANSCQAVFIITSTGFSSFSYSSRDQKTGFFDTFSVSMATRKVAKDSCLFYLANSCLAVFIITKTGFSSFSYSLSDQKTGFFDTFSVSMATRKVAKDGCILYLANSCLAVFMITNTGFSSSHTLPGTKKRVYLTLFPSPWKQERLPRTAVYFI